jgi:hypothetical protein
MDGYSESEKKQSCHIPREPRHALCRVIRLACVIAKELSLKQVYFKARESATYLIQGNRARAQPDPLSIILHDWPITQHCRRRPHNSEPSVFIVIIFIDPSYHPCWTRPSHATEISRPVLPRWGAERGYRCSARTEHRVSSGGCREGCEIGDNLACTCWRGWLDADARSRRNGWVYGASTTAVVASL